jgi:hypothetical protein
MSTIEKVLPSEINLVQFDNPKLLATKPMLTLPSQTKQVLYNIFHHFNIVRYVQYKCIFVDFKRKDIISNTIGTIDYKY